MREDVMFSGSVGELNANSEESMLKRARLMIEAIYRCDRGDAVTLAIIDKERNKHEEVIKELKHTSSMLCERKIDFEEVVIKKAPEKKNIFLYKISIPPQTS